jgi:FAD/FMN-containing dehydrogenase
VDAHVYEPLLALDGSVSAEHGIGMEKKHWLGRGRTPQELQLMRQLKRSLDPKNLLNPGMVFDLNDEARNHDRP